MDSQQQALPEPIVSAKNGFVVTAEQIREDLGNLQTSYLPKLKTDSDRLADFVLDRHSTRMLVKQAENEGLAATQGVRFKLQNAYEKVLLEAYFETKVAEEMPSEEKLRALARQEYQANAERYVSPERRRVAHIYIRHNTDDDAAFRKIHKIYDELEQGGDFAELAKEYSDDEASAKRNGAIEGEFAKGGPLVRTFEDALFGLAQGEYSRPVETKFGWHIVKNLEIIPGGVEPYESVAADLLQKERSAARSRLAEKLRSSAYPKLDEVNFDVLKELIQQEYESRSGAEG